MDNVKYAVTLHSALSNEQKQQAYNIMGYVLVEYTREHCVSKEVANALNKALLAEYIKPVNVMY